MVFSTFLPSNGRPTPILDKLAPHIHFKFSPYTFFRVGLPLALLDFGPIDVGEIGPVTFKHSAQVISPALKSIFTLNASARSRFRSTLGQEIGDGAFF